MKVTKEQKLMEQVILEAQKNETFKKELIANPLVAMEKLTGEKPNVPDGKTIVIQDQTTEDIIYINIPKDINVDDFELNEEQLEAVAGGATILPPINNFPPLIGWPLPPPPPFPTNPIEDR